MQDWANALSCASALTTTSPPVSRGGDFALAGSGVVVNCQPTPSPSFCAPCPTDVGRIVCTKAELISRFKSVAEDGGVMELVVWRVPRPVPPTEHGY
jgi:hypothetical protein